MSRAGGERPASIVADSAHTFVLWVLTYGVGFVASVLISRGLGPAGRGEYYLPIVTAGTMVALCKLGLEQANVYLFGSRAVSIARLAAQSTLVAGVVGGLGILLVQAAPALLPALFADTSRLFLALAALTIPLSLHAQLVAGLLTLRGEITWPFRAGLVAGVVQVGLLLGLLALRALGVAAVLAVNLVTAVVSWAVTAWRLRDGWARWPRCDTDLLRESLRHSLVLHLGMVLLFLHLRVDMFMIKGMLGTAALGRYSIAVALAETMLLVTDSLAIAVLPRQMGNSLPEAATLALSGARTDALLGIVAAAAWVALGWPVISRVFGADFEPAYPPLLALLPGMVFLGMQRMCGAPVLRTGQAWRMTAVYALSLLANVGLNRLWIPAWGILGAALASSVSYGLGATLFLAWTARLAGTPLWSAIRPTRSDFLTLRQAPAKAFGRVPGLGFLW